MRRIGLLVCFLGLGFGFSFGQEVDSLLLQGKSLLDQNRPTEAVPFYEQVLEKDARNYESLAFLCNYHYLMGVKALEKVETDYRSKSAPNRMQIAQYQEELKRIYYTYYEKAEVLLAKAFILKKNDHLDNIAGCIADYKQRIGLPTASTSRRRSGRAFFH
jgi:hypothetical protein